MKSEKNKFIVFDALVFALKNIGAYARPLVILQSIGILLTFVMVKFRFDLLSCMSQKTVLLLLGSALLSGYVGIVLLHFYLLIVSGQATQKIEFPSLRKVINVFGAMFLILLGTVVGLVMLVVPALWWTIRTFFAPYIVLKEDVSIITAIKKSFRLTDGYEWQISFFWIYKIFAPDPIFAVGDVLFTSIAANAFMGTVLGLAGAYMYSRLDQETQDSGC